MESQLFPWSDTWMTVKTSTQWFLQRNTGKEMVPAKVWIWHFPEITQLMHYRKRSVCCTSSYVLDRCLLALIIFKIFKPSSRVKIYMYPLIWLNFRGTITQLIVNRYYDSNPLLCVRHKYCTILLSNVLSDPLNRNKALEFQWITHTILSSYVYTMFRTFETHF